jgi:hypothetical protein
MSFLFGGNTQSAFELKYESSDETAIDAPHDASNPIILASWKITRAGAADARSLILYAIASVQVKRDSGAGNIVFGWFRSSDGVTWTSFDLGSGNSAVYQSRYEGLSGGYPNGISDDYFGFGIANNDTLSTGTIKDIVAIASIILAIGDTIEAQ